MRNPTASELKILLDFKNYLNKCTDNKVSNEDIKGYVEEDHFHKNIFNQELQKAI